MRKKTVAGKKEEGQILPLAALALLVIVTLMLFGVRLTYLFSADSFLRQRVDFAAAAAARPDGDALSAGLVQIDQNKGEAAARAELVGAFRQLEFVGATANEMMQNTTIEFVNPSPGNCEQFPGDATCYRVPAVRVTASIPFDLFGVTVNLTRQGIATIAAEPGDGGVGVAPLEPTPIVLPTEVFVPTATPQP